MRDVSPPGESECCICICVFLYCILQQKMFASAEPAEEYTCHPFNGDDTPPSLPRRSTTSWTMSRVREKVRSAFMLCFYISSLQQKMFWFHPPADYCVYLASSSGWRHTSLFAPQFNDIINNDEARPRGCEIEHYQNNNQPSTRGRTQQKLCFAGAKPSRSKARMKYNNQQNNWWYNKERMLEGNNIFRGHAWLFLTT